MMQLNPSSPSATGICPMDGSFNFTSQDSGSFEPVGLTPLANQNQRCAFYSNSTAAAATATTTTAGYYDHLSAAEGCGGTANLVLPLSNCQLNCFCAATSTSGPDQPHDWAGGHHPQQTLFECARWHAADGGRAKQQDRSTDSIEQNLDLLTRKVTELAIGGAFR